ncbi:MAG: PhoH family protein, partial [Halothiobacillus sp.]|nr:PhoH family protein [Halothiobacillus sp.]
MADSSLDSSMSPIDQRTARLDFALPVDPQSGLDNERLVNLAGSFDAHLRVIERRMGVEINHRGADFSVIGEIKTAQQVEKAIRDLYELSASEIIDLERVNLFLQAAGLQDDAPAAVDEIQIRTQRGIVRGRGARQIRYLQSIAKFDLNFGIGPAGTGKTYLAVASAVDALERGAVQRIVLVRPAVEAGEKLG